MKAHGLLFWLVAAIAALTVVSGIVQIIWPAVILSFISGPQTAASLHFFGLVGMFMALFGGALLNALFAQGDNKVVVIWAGLQKFGAVAGVGIGVWHGVFSALALLVAGFDFLSALVIFLYLFNPGWRP